MDKQQGLEKINYDKLEQKFKKKYYIITVVFLISLSIIEVSFMQKDYFTYFVILQAFLIFPFFPNYLFIKTVKCPKCGSNYFTSFFAGKDEIKSLLKSNPKCVNCNYEAEIISESKTMC